MEVNSKVFAFSEQQPPAHRNEIINTSTNLKFYLPGISRHLSFWNPFLTLSFAIG